MSAPVTRERATVYRAENGRRYLTRASALRATAKARMRARCQATPTEWDERIGNYVPGESCGCPVCDDDRQRFRRVRNRYARMLARTAGPETTNARHEAGR